MTTLRRELIQKVKPILESWNCHDEEGDLLTEIVDAVLELRAFKPKLDTAKMGIDWLAAGVMVSQEQIDAEKFEKKALEAFEIDMGCPKNWDWYPSRTSEDAAWRILREFVVEQYRKDPKCFQAYKTWSTQPFSTGKMGVLAIKRNPENFPASWSDFLAANPNYGKQEERVSKTDSSGAPITY